MENNENGSATIAEATEAQKTDAKQKRSASYPAFTVTDAFNFASKINEKFGNAEVTRKEIASVLKVHPNTISREVASAAAYGFFDKTLHKGEADVRYKLSDLFNDTFLYENGKQRQINFITAFGKPKLYSDLIAKFDGTLIAEELPNTLIKHHSITENAAKEAADVFIKSGIEVGVINENRVLNYKVTLAATQKTQYAEVFEEPPNRNAPTNNNNLLPVKLEQTYIPESDVKIPIHLTKNKTAYMVYPNDINDKDIKLLNHAIEGILLRLDLEKDEGANAPSNNNSGNDGSN
jgi:hypothetical protein